jgi:glutamine amidotransferase
MTDVAIIDSGGANIASLQFALQRLGVESRLTRARDELLRASHVILPGVGSAADAMTRLAGYGLTEFVPRLTQPVLGICLGMQLLFEDSDEGDARCLGIIPGRARRFESVPGRPVPHMGWNQLEVTQRTPLSEQLRGGDYVYFVHSYALPAGRYTTATCDYGTRFSAMVQRDNFHGVQFHPERSSRTGANILRGFLGLQA